MNDLAADAVFKLYQALKIEQHPTFTIRLTPATVKWVKEHMDNGEIFEAVLEELLGIGILHMTTYEVAEAMNRVWYGGHFNHD